MLVGNRIGEALGCARGEVILCGLPGLIMKFINPEILSGTGYATVEELSLSEGWQKVMQRELAGFSGRQPHSPGGHRRP